MATRPGELARQPARATPPVRLAGRLGGGDCRAPGGMCPGARASPSVSWGGAASSVDPRRAPLPTEAAHGHFLGPSPLAASSPRADAVSLPTSGYHRSLPCRSRPWYARR